MAEKCGGNSQSHEADMSSGSSGSSRSSSPESEAAPQLGDGVSKGDHSGGSSPSPPQPSAQGVQADHRGQDPDGAEPSPPDDLPQDRGTQAPPRPLRPLAAHPRRRQRPAPGAVDRDADAEGGPAGAAAAAGHEQPVCPLTPDQIETGIRILRWRYRGYTDRETLIRRLINCSVTPPPDLSRHLLGRLERGLPTYGFYTCQSDDGPADPEELGVSEEERDLLDRAREWLLKLLCVCHHLNPDRPFDLVDQ